MFSHKNKVFLGYEVFFDHAINGFIINQQVPREAYFPPLRHNIFIGHEFIFGQIALMTQFFVYVDRGFGRENSFGNKLGPKFYLLKPQENPRFNVFGGIYLKNSSGSSRLS